MKNKAKFGQRFDTNKDKHTANYTANYTAKLEKLQTMRHVRETCDSRYHIGPIENLPESPRTSQALKGGPSQAGNALRLDRPCYL